MATLPNTARAWPRPVPEPAPTIPAAEDDVAGRLQKKEARIRAEAGRPLDPWERYRALTDLVEEGFTLTEIADRKVRFALVVMAGLNLGVYVLTSRGEVAVGRAWTMPWAVAYGIVAVYFLLQAVEALRPREVGGRSRVGIAPHGRLRDVEAAAQGELDDFQRAWREVRFDELASEVVARAHELARCNRDKYEALRRLYAGLRAMALLVGALLLLTAASAVLTQLGG